MSKKLDIFLIEARRYYDISVDIINSYDRKLAQVFTMCTAIIGITLVGISLEFNALDKKSLMLNLSAPVPIIWILAFLTTIFSAIIALCLCLKGLKLQKIRVTNPNKLFEKYEDTNEDEMKNFLIVQLGKMYDENAKYLKEIKDMYIKSITCLNVSVVAMLILFLSTLLLVRGIYL